MSTLEELLEQAKSIKMTDSQKLDQRLDFAYGNLAASTNHKPRRAAFKQLADQLGMAATAFEDWAAKREWSVPSAKESKVDG
jgi:hypothetical protein